MPSHVHADDERHCLVESLAMADFRMLFGIDLVDESHGAMQLFMRPMHQADVGSCLHHTIGQWPMPNAPELNLVNF